MGKVDFLLKATQKEEIKRCELVLNQKDAMQD